MIEAIKLQERILEQLDMTKEVDDEELTGMIHQILKEAGEREYISLNVKTSLGRELFNAFRKLDLLQEFLEDEEITEIMINGTQNIFIEKNGARKSVDYCKVVFYRIFMVILDYARCC